MNEYWKKNLKPTNQILYSQMVTAFQQKKKDICCGDFDVKDISATYEAVYNDHAEFFYLSFAPKISQKVNLFGKGEKSLIIDYIFNSQEIKKYEIEIEKIYDLLKNQLLNLNEVEKEKLICNYVIKNTNYSINNKMNQNAATVLLQHEGQCSGISKAVKLLFDHFNIDSMIVTGEMLDKTTNVFGSHAWNIVKINGFYYHLDVTSMIGCNMQKIEPFIYLFYNYSDQQMEQTHRWQRSKFPQCISSFNSEDEKIISSLYELRELLKKIDFSMRNQITFICDIPCIDKEHLMKLISSTTLSVITQRKEKKKIAIKMVGQIINISFSEV